MAIMPAVRGARCQKQAKPQMIMSQHKNTTKRMPRGSSAPMGILPRASAMCVSATEISRAMHRPKNSVGMMDARRFILGVP